MEWDYGLLLVSFIPVILAIVAGIMDYCFWKKSIRPDENNSERFYKPNPIFYRLGTVLGIVVVALYLLAYLIPSLLKDCPSWQDVILRLGIISGIIAALAILAKMTKEE